MSVQHDQLYRHRFADVNQAKRTEMWNVLCRAVLQRYVDPGDTVVDLGAGFGEFINNIRCAAKIAVDTNPSVRAHVRADVKTIVGAIPAVLEQVPDAGVGVVFCSNFLEHLANKDAVMAVLAQVRRILRPGGYLIVLQPNIRYAYKEYWDFFDHHVPLSDASLGEALQLGGYELVEVRARFLPYTTTKSKLPQSAWLLRLYLALPPLQWIFGKQMLVIARRPRDGVTAGGSIP